MKTNKELIKTLKKATKDAIKNFKEKECKCFERKHEQIYFKFSGMALAFRITKKISQPEYDAFDTWIYALCTIEYEVNEGWPWKPVYKKYARWKGFYD